MPLASEGTLRLWARLRGTEPQNGAAYQVAAPMPGAGSHAADLVRRCIQARWDPEIFEDGCFRLPALDPLDLPDFGVT